MLSDGLSDIVEKNHQPRGGLIATLQAIQSRYGYLPAESLRTLADATGRSLVEIYGVATFYRSFSLTPRGRHLCSVCLGTACHVRGGPVIAEEFGRALGIEPGETTPDGEFTLETVNCLGACALGPIVVVDGRYFSNVSPVRVAQIVEQARAGLDRVEVTSDPRIFPLEAACPRCQHSLMDPDHPLDGCPSVRLTLSCGRERGRLRLSCLYGSRTVQAESEIPPDTLVKILCPHCHAELGGASSCPECGARMVPLIVQGGGIVQFCPRRGCPGHRLDLGSGGSERLAGAGAPSGCQGSPSGRRGTSRSSGPNHGETADA